MRCNSSAAPQSLAWAVYTELKRFAQKSQLAACNTLVQPKHEALTATQQAYTAARSTQYRARAAASCAEGAVDRCVQWLQAWLQNCWL